MPLKSVHDLNDFPSQGVYRPGEPGKVREFEKTPGKPGKIREFHRDTWKFVLKKMLCTFPSKSIDVPDICWSKYY